VASETIGGGTHAILEDPRGRRALWMRRAGRVVFLLFLCWLLVIVLGGLGLIPVKGIPLVRAMRVSQGPPELAKLPTPVLPSASDLRPALPAGSTASAVTAPQPVAPKAAPVHGKSTAAPGRTKTKPARRGGSAGKSAAAPGRAKAPPAPAGRGKSAEAPGRTKAPAAGGSAGKSAAAPGKAEAEAPAAPAGRGKSAEAPGPTKGSPAAADPHGAAARPPASPDPPTAASPSGGKSAPPGRASHAPPGGGKSKKP
jgi:hypothetical protein